MQKDRDPSFDAFRGIAIIAVVAIHVTYLDGHRNFSFPFCYQLFNFAIPSFVFISGYWLSRKPIESLKDYKTFLTRRLSRILVPYLFWSLILLGLAVIKTHTIDVPEIIFKLLTGGASGGYYFIILIAQFYVITPLLQYINRSRYRLISVLILNVITLLFRYLSRFYFDFWFPSASVFYSWIIFYEIGLLAGGRDSTEFPPRNMRLFILPAIVISLLISELEGMIILLRYDNASFAAYSLKYSSFLYSVCIIAGFLFVRQRIRYWPKLLVTIGNYSFGIYLIHLIVLGQVAGVAERINTLYSFQPLYQLVVLLITVSICVILIGITRKLLPRSFCTKVLAF